MVDPQISPVFGPWLGPLFTGAATGAALILAIGAQNAFVLRQGLRREQVGLVVALCAGSDVLLIQAGVWGLGTVLAAAPWLDALMRAAGGLFLLAYGVLAARRALRPAAVGLQAAGAAAPASARAVAITTLALTWLNPHVYLDTVLLLGSVAAPYREHGPRLAFALGASAASVLWFTALGFGARLLAPWFARPRAWQWLDGAVAVLMVGLAIGLLRPLISPWLAA